ncbi:hypothetical protein GW17_00051657 [Ensete ventricosum]|nr:hypothetical protein GW17_00051657 [Ensete ventricosum]RZS15799.1 hypothetical protein BHM03_00047682 [Ensete ventricosum]
MAIPSVLAHEKSYEHGFLILAHKKSYVHGFMKKHDAHNLCTKMHAVSFRSIFRAPSQNFKILAISNILAHGTSYDHSFMKKCNGYKLCVKSCFDHFFGHRIEISKYWPSQLKFRSIFCAPSRNLNKLAIPNVLALAKSYEHGFTKKCDGHKLCPKSCANPRSIDFSLVSTAHKKSYEHGFTKKRDDHKLCVKSRFNQFFMNRLGIPKH